MKIINSIKIAKLMSVFGLTLLLTFAGCENEEFFELDGPPVTSWRTIPDMEMGIANAYRLTIVQNESACWNFMPFVHFGQSDIVREISVNGGWNSNVTYSRDFQQRIGQTDKFSICYQVILYCNNMIDFVDSNPFPDASEADKTKNINRIKGEALFLRALAYYHLLIWYTPAFNKDGANDAQLLPLRIKTPVNLEIALDNTPAATKDVYAQVVKDFTEAKALLPLKWEAGMHNAFKFGRTNKHAAGAFLARTLMQMGKYDEALTELNAVLDDTSMPRTLENDPEVNWLNNSATAAWTSSEIIWYGFYADINLSTAFRHNMMFHYFDNVIFPNVDDWRDWWIWSLNTKTVKRCGMLADDNSVPAGWANDKRSKLVHRWEGYDNSLPSTTKYNYKYLVNRAFEGRVGKIDPVYMSSKYFRVPAFGQAKTAAPQNLPIIRSAELYLWRAALKQITGKGGQAADLNKVRQRAWDTAKSGAYVPLTDAEANWEMIDQEWIKEMNFEGDRIIWLQMFRKPIGPGDRSVPDVNAPYANFFYPLPLSETDFNKK
ncbi:MAG: RagB/SusD family nutrient uptake outer membrane protein [Bacteroidota bacterium]|nr:RagB/SusD family nutrient uptake outer membrane protein [Bacteroidota bacterium]